MKDITGTAEAPAESNPYGKKIINSASFETLLKVTVADKAAGVNVWLDVQDGTATVPATDKVKILIAARDCAVGQYLDIKLFEKVGNEIKEVHDTNGKVKTSIVIPASLRKEGRTFRIIKVHNGEDEEEDEEDDDEPAQTAPVDTTTPRSPKTGDNMMGYSFWMTLAAAGLAVSGYAVLGRRKEEE